MMNFFRMGLGMMFFRGLLFMGGLFFGGLRGFMGFGMRFNGGVSFGFNIRF